MLKEGHWAQMYFLFVLPLCYVSAEESLSREGLRYASSATCWPA